MSFFRDPDEDGITFRVNLKGWSAIIFIIAIIGLLITSSHKRFKRAVSQKDECKQALLTHFRAYQAQRVTKRMKEMENAPLKHKKTLYKNVAKDLEVNINILEIRGFFMGDPVIKFEYTVGGKPVNGIKHHYYQVEFDRIGGWDPMQIFRSSEEEFNMAIWREKKQ